MCLWTWLGRANFLCQSEKWSWERFLVQDGGSMEGVIANLLTVNPISTKNFWDLWEDFKWLGIKLEIAKDHCK